MILETLTALESSESTRVGYWATHPYYRLNVEKYVQQFCGYQALTELIDLIYDETQKAFFVTMFLTGGRVTEVSLLKRENFTVNLEKDIIEVTNMRLLKQYRKLDGYKVPLVDKKTGETIIDKETGEPKTKNRWHTKKLVIYRTDFVIDRREPFVPILERYLEELKHPKAYLFPSPYSHHSRKFKNKHLVEMQDEAKKHVRDVYEKYPYSKMWAYQIIRKVNDNIPQLLIERGVKAEDAELKADDLKKRLGLKKPWYDEEGNLISDEIHLWLHWFRSQRASELASVYHFDAIELKDYFDWKDVEVAVRYAKKGGEVLTKKMKDTQPDFR